MAKHGNRAVSSASGSADVLEALGFSLEQPVERIERSIDELGFGFMFAPSHHPAMRHAAPVRRELAARTVFNVLGPLTNPAGARAQVIGVYMPSLVRTIADVLAQLGARRAFVVHGAHGIDELSPAGPNDVCEVVDGEVRERVIDPLELGIQRCDPAELRGGSPAENAQAIRDVLAGADGGRRDAILLNAAGAIAAAGHAEDLREGLELAREAIDSGAAAERLDELARFSQCGLGTRSAAPGLGAIAEFKRRSPSLGDIRPDAEPGALAADYERAGAAAVSILVDERFGGDWDDLRAARASVELPLLAKGFFSTERAPAHGQGSGRGRGAAPPPRPRRRPDGGADARSRTSSGSTRSSRRTTPTSSTRAIALRAPVIGINARDLATFAIDRSAQLELVAAASPADRVVVAESGIHTRAQGAAAELAGADAILVGSALMQAPDPGEKLRELLARPLVKVCGLTREEDVAVAAEAGADLAGFILARESPRAATEVLPVPDELLAVAVWVGEAGASDASLDQLHEREEGAVRGRDAVLLRDGEPVAKLLDLPWNGDDPEHWDRAAVDARAGRARRKARRRQRRARRSGRCARGRSTRARGWRPSPGSRIPTRCARTSRRLDA